MLNKAAINGARARAEHPAIPRHAGAAGVGGPRGGAGRRRRHSRARARRRPRTGEPCARRRGPRPGRHPGRVPRDRRRGQHRRLDRAETERATGVHPRLGGVTGLRLRQPPRRGGATDHSARATLEAIEAVLGRVGRPRLLHGVDASAWELVEPAARRGYDTRTGLEDTLALPDGSRADGNAALVAAARRIVAGDIAR